MNKRIKENQNGFTLIEIMIAVTVLTIGILAIAKMQLSAVKGNSYASGLTEASTLAQDKMEELMSLAYDDSDLDDDDGDGTGRDVDNDGFDDDTNDDTGNNFGLDDTTSPDGGPEQYIGQTSIQYAIDWNIAIDEPVTDSKRIRVHVLWRQNGVNKRLTLNSVNVVM